MASNEAPRPGSRRNVFDSIQVRSNDSEEDVTFDREEDDFDAANFSEGEMSDEDEFLPFSDDSDTDRSSDDDEEDSADPNLNSSISEEVVNGNVVRTRSYYGKDGTEWKSTTVAPNCRTADLWKEFCKNMILYKRHVYHINRQFKHFEKIKHNLKPSEMLVHIDFAQNYVGQLYTEVHVQSRELFQSHNITEEDKPNPAHLWSLFENHLVEKPNKWLQRLEFQQITQQASESVDEFVVRLRNKAEKCSFQLNQKDDRITEQLIKGILWKEEKKNLISKGEELTLTVAIEMAKSFEASNRNLDEY
ncbi:hypothetical protein ElyMa_001417400 [Elysia marginata]|uniref:Retrotransposon gag domain-containing protein n=1 Tax=Elysia marginata TaxID=1093978 RepID=A0AAV4IYA0_9GAST|nr:hypothetical protein ElyMa_001417400 [Elysia marginata]